jgi:methionyl-tRNA formyltransferase
MRMLLLGQGKIFQACVNALVASQSNGNLASINAVGWISNDRLNNGKGFPCITEYKFVEWSDLKKIIIDQRVDCIFSIKYPRIIPKSILELVGYRAFNFHNAKLPDYRGHHSLTYEILNEETEHVMTIHWMVEEVDRGYHAATKSIPIAASETAYSLYAKCMSQSPSFFLNFLMLLHSGDIPKIAIIGQGRYYSINLPKEISKNLDSGDVEKYARALYFPGFEPAYFMNKGKKVYVLPECFLSKEYIS